MTETTFCGGLLIFDAHRWRRNCVRKSKPRNTAVSPVYIARHTACVFASGAFSFISQLVDQSRQIAPTAKHGSFAGQALEQTSRLMHIGDSYRASPAPFRLLAAALWALVLAQASSVSADALDARDQVQSFQQEHAHQAAGPRA